MKSTPKQRAMGVQRDRLSLAAMCALVFSLTFSCLNAQLPEISSSFIPGLLHGRPSDVFQDAHGLVWLCYESRGKGLFVYDGVSVRQLTAQVADSSGLPDINISSPVLMQDGSIWMGTGTQAQVDCCFLC